MLPRAPRCKAEPNFSAMVRGRVSFPEAQQCRTLLASTLIAFRSAQKAAEHASTRCFRFVDLWERRAKTQFLWIACVNAGDEWPNQLFQQFRRKFAANEGPDRFFGDRRGGAPEQVSQEGQLCACADETRGEKSWWA